MHLHYSRRSLLPIILSFILPISLTAHFSSPSFLSIIFSPPASFPPSLPLLLPSLHPPPPTHPVQQPSIRAHSLPPTPRAILIRNQVLIVTSRLSRSEPARKESNIKKRRKRSCIPGGFSFPQLRRPCVACLASRPVIMGGGQGFCGPLSAINLAR